MHAAADMGTAVGVATGWSILEAILLCTPKKKPHQINDRAFPNNRNNNMNLTNNANINYFIRNLNLPQKYKMKSMKVDTLNIIYACG